MLAKFGLCLICSQNLDECSFARARKNFAMGLMHNYVIQCMRVRLGGIAKQVPPFSASVCSISTYWLEIYLFNSETVWNKRQIKFNPPPEEE